MRPKSLVLILIALGCGLIASIGISQVVEKRGDGDAEVQTSPIYVAMSDINIAEEFGPQNIKLEEWPVDKIPAGAVTDAEELEGMCPTTRLYQGEPILLFKIASRDELSTRAGRIKPGYRVMSVRVSLDTGVSNMVRPGDNVDVLVFIAETGNARTEVILEKIEVFAVNDQVERTIDADGTTIQAQTVSLLVKPEQAKQLMLYSHIGRLSFSLRSPDDKNDTAEVATPEIDLTPMPPTVNLPFGNSDWSVDDDREKFQMEIIDGEGPSVWVWDDLDELPRRADPEVQPGYNMGAPGRLPGSLSPVPSRSPAWCQTCLQASQQEAAKRRADRQAVPPTWSRSKVSVDSQTENN